MAVTDYIDDRPNEGVFRVNPAIFTDRAVFDAEIRTIFEGGWVFLGLSSQAEQPHDYCTTQIGRVSVLVQRSGQGELGAFINACRHKGARLAQLRQGSAALHVCPYHSWSFDSAGRNKAIKSKRAGCYSDAFNQDDHGLIRLPHFANYRGFLFGSLTPDVPPLTDHLGEAAKLLDLVADEGERGLELVPGQVTFTYAANWKLQLENCSDAYHFTSTHPSYIRVLERRQQEFDQDVVASVWESSDYWKDDATGIGGGSFSFVNGHALNWGVFGVTAASPLYDRSAQLAERHGEAKRDWMFNMRNLTIFPNLQIAENASSQLRIIRPLAPNLTEMRTWCLAPKGESAAARRQRIRQYEDFFNPTGMATPDDTISYENCQMGYGGGKIGWLQGYARGMTASVPGGNRFGDLLGLHPERSVLADPQLCDETLFHSYYRAWANRMKQELSA
ncbi:aromatic ring-hydroxylating oxygenase subunit alpha [Novosphingobium sp. KACC 22771]|uniref:aromatic ring-hydroxylating oxygenase subunit alpha n=1 Tax=Novosphingobium sp. KACC 22771 TaxID=3025670 RepID=UPI0023660B83|nr:aromatic ring-hydroxylating dioxygenase subunit alpha [Novosphingobium sp. KACC 22771]WDF74408.1 aromatic ring-hydroxylating dioxygenase subunit alpha [Novosphingobium sp. KACC 22771]